MRKSFKLSNLVAVAICFAGLTMFSGCDKDSNEITNIGLPFHEYKLPENIYIEWKPNVALSMKITKIGNDYLSTDGNSASTDYCLKYDAATKTWREYAKALLQGWAPLEVYTEAEIAAKLKEDRYLGFVLGALDGDGFSKTGIDGVSVGTNNATSSWETVTRSANVYTDGTTTLYKDIEYGIALESKMGGVSWQKVSFIGTRESFSVALP